MKERREKRVVIERRILYVCKSRKGGMKVAMSRCRDESQLKLCLLVCIQSRGNECILSSNLSG
jgi:hypothetical protein